MINKDRLTMEVVHQVAEQNPMFIYTLATSMDVEMHELIRKIGAGDVSLLEAFSALVLRIDDLKYELRTCADT
jgi:hypothetical protein